MKENDYRASMILECLGEPIRFQIVRLLHNKPMAVVELAQLTRRHQVTICQHLAALRSLHIVRYRNQGRFTFYELKLKTVPQILDLAVRCAEQVSDMPRLDK